MIVLTGPDCPDTALVAGREGDSRRQQKIERKTKWWWELVSEISGLGPNRITETLRRRSRRITNSMTGRPKSAVGAPRTLNTSTTRTPR